MLFAVTACCLASGVVAYSGGSTLAAFSDTRDVTATAAAASSWPQTPVVPAACAGRTFTNVIVGTEGRDILRGTSGGDLILGLGGNDVIGARGGDDCVDAGAGRDVINGGTGTDICLGETGHDVVTQCETIPGWPWGPPFGNGPSANVTKMSPEAAVPVPAPESAPNAPVSTVPGRLPVPEPLPAPSPPAPLDIFLPPDAAPVPSPETPAADEEPVGDSGQAPDRPACISAPCEVAP